MLTLPIKKKWFDMILSGEKPEEYRDYTPYYISRFMKYLGKSVRIKFRNGYRSDSPAIERMVIPRIGTGRTEWGAEAGKRCFVLEIQSKEDALNA
jgi:hypothetical protein